MRVYLAAKFSEQALMREWRKLLMRNGHTVTSRWLEYNEVDLKSETGKEEATVDLMDINSCDVMISKTLNRGELFTGGGRHVEFGFALAQDKLLINVGGRENVFHSFAKQVSTIEEAIGLLNEAPQSKS